MQKNERNAAADPPPLPSPAKHASTYDFPNNTSTNVLSSAWNVAVCIGPKIVSITQEEKRGLKAVASRVLTSTAERPEYNKAIKIIEAAARKAQQGAGDGEDME